LNDEVGIRYEENELCDAEKEDGEEK